MKAAVQFLGGLAQALATMSLYSGEHPARTRALDQAYASLKELQTQVARPYYSFLSGDVIFGHQPLAGVKDWPWGSRLSSVGIQRVEFTEGLEREEFEAFLEEVLARLTLLAGDVPAVAKLTNFRSVRFGAVGLKGEQEVSPDQASSVSMDYGLGEEIAALSWLNTQVETGDNVPRTEAEAVVRSLSVAMRGDNLLVLPLLRMRASQEYRAVHAINVSVLAMAMANELELSARDVHAFGLAGLLYDLGMARLPKEIVTKIGPLTDEERVVLQGHPVEGARLIMKSDRALELAAAVAFEHHIRPDGSGYPQPKVQRHTHYASRLIRVCDVYDALRTERPFRPAWASETALYYIELYAGTEFDPEVARTFCTMLRRIEKQVLEQQSATEAPAL
ncbi:MAG: HD domain-containing protein [Gemmatimonadota bacterium]|nr:HD domain-containing protein [Gemmatimonadota bacterium]